jgi:tRNA modification GTPase
LFAQPDLPQVVPLLVGRTIAAIATASGGGIGIIRVSGAAAESIGRALCRPWPTDLRSHQLYLGSVAVAGQPIDQVLFCLMQAPHSYTGEDVLELHGHGGAVNLRRLLDACLQAGATPAAPGEFTRRAFLAGKLDLTRAEAVAALIGAHSDQAARQAQRQLSGELGRVVSDLRRRTIALLGDFEGMLDFPDLDEDRAILDRAQPQLAALTAQLTSLAASFASGGKALSGGIELAVLGQTNAGKSSLINALCRAERVIVDAQPGTTRDYIEVRSDWQGVQVTLIDTAGERAAATPLEAEGLRLGRQRWAHADLLLLVVDGTRGIGDQEERLLASRPPGVPYLVVWNKQDRLGCLPPPSDAIACSALCGWGLEALERRVLAQLAPQLGRQDDLLVTSERQAALLGRAADALGQAEAANRSGSGAEIVAGELRVAASQLGELTGEAVSDGVLDAIFAQFCVGK